jgi:hypothetical protein
MSSLACKCGHTIKDNVCPSPTEADVVGHTAYEVLDREFTRDVDSFLAAVRNGTRDEWINAHFNAVYPKSLSDSEVISDILSSHYVAHSLRLSECEKCGRLWIQEGPEENSYRSFVPDVGNYGRHLLIVGDSVDLTENATNNPIDRSGGSAAS